MHSLFNGFDTIGQNLGDPMAEDKQTANKSLEQKLNKIESSYSIRKRTSEKGVCIESDLTKEDVGNHAWVLDDACARMAWVAAHELLRSQEKHRLLRIENTHLNAFAQGEGACLQAVAEVIFKNGERCAIRVQLFRGAAEHKASPETLIAEYNLQGIWYDIGEAAAKAEEIVAARNEQQPVASKSAPLSAKEQAIEDKKRRIFEGACEVIGREGYAATTIRKVAKAAGLPISTMYQYIESKEDLLFMITSGCMEEIFDYMYEEMSTDHPPVQKLEEAVSAYMKYISKNRRYINLVYRETRALSRHNREKVFDIERKFTQLWEAIIIEGNKEGVFDAPKSRLAANMVYFFCNVWSLRYWSVQDYTEDEVKEYLMRFIRQGLN